MPYSTAKTILLVDDNPDDRLLARRELYQAFEDITIHEVIDQKEFDRWLISEDFDLVVTDYQLGWSNGINILRAIKAQRPQCPVIMFTNTGTQEIAVEAMKSGLSDYVIKSPQHFIRLRQAVRSAWRQFQIELKSAQLEGQLQALLTQLSVGIFRATPDGSLLDANPALLHMLGVDTLTAAQKIFQTQLAIPTSTLPSSLSTDAATDSTTGVRVGRSRTREIEVQSAGHSLWLRVITTLSLINGDAIVDGLIEDITARKQAEHSLQQLNQTLEAQVKDRTQKLEAINQELESFAYAVSHDLRSPIRQIEGFVSLLQEQLASSTLNEKAQHYFSIITQLTTRAGNMIDGLLHFSRTGRVEMKTERVDMGELVAQLRQKIDENLPPERDILWEIAPLPAVSCDRILIETVWQNLLDNAVKFTAQQSQPVITIGAENSIEAGSGQSPELAPDSIVFFVKDNGIGFDPHQADKIFDMFQQVHSRGIFKEGTGIGLASVKRIILRHRGRVWAKSAPAQGAAIYFSLPDNA